ncbi:phage virion morphogenesis protein [Pseudomonas moraviensis]|uniref:phage virion morphogenesis protein n=1 Tax=Pseudomonas moraviensis TaxID=321662 RepID=UPI0020924D6B|nr:phage virion morphogenesis protein [Pseudomonas moraviensis]UST71425.1 phage virion morphogenesis protein [Pseudomonas moraviensis]
MLTIELNNQRLQQTLHQLEDAIGDLTPLMQAIAAELASQTEENFEHEGRPEWPELSDVTIERRAKQGHWPGQMLQVSAGGLAASIVTHATDSSAVVGSNKPYAAMMQFGGQRADFPQLWGDIPARQYLPVDSEGTLQPETEQAILDLAMSHLDQQARSSPSRCLQAPTS